MQGGDFSFFFDNDNGGLGGGIPQQNKTTSKDAKKQPVVQMQGDFHSISFFLFPF